MNNYYPTVGVLNKILLIMSLCIVRIQGHKVAQNIILTTIDY